MPDVKRNVKIVTEQKVNPDKAPIEEGYPYRNWTIEIFVCHESDPSNLLPASMFEKVTYKLHPSFDKRAIQTIKQPPFRIAEEGWGEFDLQIILSTMNKGGDHTLEHDLNFQSERYEAVQRITFKNPKPELLAVLRESGSVPGDENGVKKADGAKKKNRSNKNVDMEKLAEGLQRLDEEGLLQVVQMIHDNKTSDTYTKNDVENGEFHVDLYTMPDNLIKILWDYATEKVFRRRSALAVRSPNVAKYARRVRRAHGFGPDIFE